MKKILSSCASILCAVLLLPFVAKGEAPSNDHFANSILLDGAHLAVVGSNLEATIEPDEPNTWFTDRSVWWSWIAPSNGCVTIRPDGTGFQTEMIVYRGTTLLDLVSVSHYSSHGMVHHTEFDAEAGTLYHIQAKGWADENVGNIRFQLDLTENTPVDFPDAHLEKIIRSRLAKPNGVLTKCELLHLQYLQIDDPAVTNLTGLEWASLLTSLQLADLNVQDFSPVSSLTNISYFVAYRTPIPNLTLFATLRSGSTLWLSECGVQNISPLENLTNVATLGIFNNPVTNYASLAKATHLKSVDIWFNENPITDLSLFLPFHSLTNLGISGSGITDLSPLLEMPKLKSLTLHDSPVTNHHLIGSLTNLDSLGFSGTAISNLDFLIPLTGLRALHIYPLGTTNLSVIAGLTNLETLGLYGIPIPDPTVFSNLSQVTFLHLNDNCLRETSYLEQMPRLSFLDLSYNQITNFSGICGLTNLWNLYITDNELEDIEFLQCATPLLNLSIDRNQIRDLSPLTNLVQMYSLSASDNLLTNVPVLGGFSIYAFGPIDVRTNLLDVRLGSDARAVIDGLIEKGANVKFTPQKLAPVFDSPPVPSNDGNFEIRMRLNPGQHYELQRSTNLVQWTSMTNFFSGDLPHVFQDDKSENHSRGFYRLVTP